MHDIAPHEDLLRAFTHWLGDLEEARALVERVRALTNPPIKAEGNALATFRRWSAWSKKHPPVPPRADYPAAAAWVAGHPGPWPWQAEDGMTRLAWDLDTPVEPGTALPDALSRALEEAKDTVCAMGYVLHDPDDRAFDALCGLVRYRPRTVWTAAVVALSRYAAASPERTDRVLKFHGELTKVRHAQALAMAMDLRGLRSPGTAWTRKPDAHDASAMLTLLAAMAKDRTPAERLAPHVQAAVAAATKHGAEASYQLWDALRDLAEDAPSVMDESAWALLLDTPADGWKTSATRIGALVGAGATAAWLHRTGQPAHAERLAAGRLRGATALSGFALAVCTGQRIDGFIEAILERMAVLRETEWFTTAPEDREVKVAELTWLLRHEEASSWRWDALVRRANVPELALGNDALTVRDAAGPALLKLLVPRNAAWMELEHIDPIQQAEALVALAVRARCPSGEPGSGKPPNEKFTQLASVMILRRLMHAPVAGKGKPDPRLAEFLLQVFMADRVFLLSAASGDPSVWAATLEHIPAPDSRAAQIARRLLAVDGANRENPDTDAGARALSAARNWIAAVKELCHLSVDANPPEARSERFDNFAAMVAGAEALRKTDTWRACAATNLEPFAEALAAWLVTDEREARELRAAATKLADRLKVADSDARITTAERTEIESALVHLRESVADQELPVRSIIASLEADIVKWAREQETKTNASDEQRARLQRLMNEADEVELERITRDLCGEATQNATRPGPSPLKSQVGDDLIGDLGRFWLRRLRFKDAARLRQHVRGEQGNYLVPSLTAHYSPLIVGICGGPLATLQLGSLTDSVMTNRGVYYTATVGMAIVISCALLWGELRRHATNVPSRQLAQRAAVPFLVILGIACVVSAAFVLLGDVVNPTDMGRWVWDETAVDLNGRAFYPRAFLTNVLLWGSLSLFQGVFVGLIAQGRAMQEG